MNEAPTGYLFKRWRGKHLSADSPIPATFYFSYEVANHRSTVCLRTTDRDTADRLAKEHMGEVNWGSREAYLRSMIELGEKAKRELWGIAHEAGACPVDKIWERYLSSRRRPDSGASTLAIYQQQVKAFTDWAPAAVKNMHRVTNALAEQYVRELEQKISVVTADKHVATLRRVWRIVDPSGPQPWTDLKPIGQHIATPYRRLTLDECKRLLQSAKKAGPEEYGLILLDYYTALRLVDAIHLQAEHVETKTKMLHLPAPRKTSRKKPAPLHIPILPELKTWLDAQTKTAPKGNIFPGLVGRYSKDRTALTKSLGKIFEDAKVLDTERGRASFHSLRATFVSAMDEAGAPARVTDIITNHAPRTMHDRYSHPDIESARTWMEKALKPITVSDASPA